jgi:2-polyprenyl-3-methyl-5-hydroxy-6-metoxy-1,4-benzoquinol methylase
MICEYYADSRPDVQAVIDPRGKRILDIGCGEGALGTSLRAAGASHIAGIEATPTAAAEARAALDVLVEGDVLAVDLPFETGEFDYLVFADVLEHLPTPEYALDRVLPLLRPDGHVVVSVPNMRFYLVLARLIADRWNYTDAGIRDRTHLRVFTRRSLLRMLESAGLVAERVERNYRLLEDQSGIGRFGAAATTVARKTVAPWLFPDLMAYQYIVVARRG